MVHCLNCKKNGTNNCPCYNQNYRPTDKCNYFEEQDLVNTDWVHHSTLTGEVKTDLSVQQICKDTLIKCPHCGKSHYSIDGSYCTSMYCPTIIKDGKVISSDHNQTTIHYTCQECGKHFTSKDAIYEEQKPSGLYVDGNLFQEIKPTFCIDLEKYETIDIKVDGEGFIIPTKNIKEKLKEIFFFDKAKEIKSIDATNLTKEDFYKLEQHCRELVKEIVTLKEENLDLKVSLARNDNRRKKNIGRNHE